jgi:ribosomal-protein-alanine N-acetyltransferase
VPSPSIELMRREDLDEVVAIERVAFTMPWSRGAFLYEIEQNRVARCWVYREDGAVAGYLCLWEVADEVHITNVAVRPDQRRRGIGRQLLSQILAGARERQIRLVCLEVRPTNVEALGLYESFGFRVVGRRKGYYYDTGEDALVMEAELQLSRDTPDAEGAVDGPRAGGTRERSRSGSREPGRTRGS